MIIDLLSCTAHETKGLRTLIAKHDGLATVLVHPYFKENEPTASPHRGPTQSYWNELERIMNQGTRGFFPLVILEERDQLERLAKRAELYGDNSVFVIPTVKEKPVADLPDGSVLNPADAIGTVLRQLGISEVRIGGRYFFFAAMEDAEGMPDSDNLRQLEHLSQLASGKPHAMEWLGKALLPYGCAGKAAQELVRMGFDVSFLKATSPDTYH